MGGRTTTYMNTLPWVADAKSLNRDNGGQIDWTKVPDRYRSTAQIVKMAAAALADAASLTVDALTAAVPAGTLLNFGEASENVRVTTDAAAGATTLAVDPLHAAIEDDDEAVIGGTGAKVIKSGTVMARLASGLYVPRAVRPGAETASRLIETSAIQDDRSAALSGYGMVLGGVVFENLLPEAVANVINSTYKTELQTAGVGTGFAFLQYADSRT